MGEGTQSACHMLAFQATGKHYLWQPEYGSPQRKRGGACNRKVHPRLHQTAITVQLVPSLQVKKLSFLEFLQNTLMLRLHKCQLENRLLSSNACGSISCDMQEYWLLQRGWDE